ncbi:MAG: ABC transporter substrate-binding protein [Lachnospiraceae bacterium]|nr:ABC transporter substrate-binding protein [Lachnospiraceae bacterium]
MKKMNRTGYLFLSMLLTAALLSGCGSSANDSSGTTAAGSTGTTENTAGADSGSDTTGTKTLTIGTGQTCTTLDPVQNYDGWYTVRFGVGQTLTRFDDDFSVSGWLVKDDYTVSEDNTVWTFTVRDDVTFSNGTKLTAELVKASLENVFENGTRGPEYFTYSSIEANGQTLTITTDSPEPILPNKLADPLFVIIDTSGDMEEIADEGPVATGPFVFSSFDFTSKQVVVTKNENYWDGDVALDEITFIYTEDQSTLTMGLQSGDFDAVYNVSMTDVESFAADDAYRVISSASGRTTHGFMNQNGLLGDEVLRQAILRYLDKETYCESLLNGQYVAGSTLVTSGAPAYGYGELTDPNAYDPESAAALLDAAGYMDINGDGYRETPDGETIDLRFIYYTGRPEQQLLVEATQAELTGLGIRITPEVHDTQTVIDMLQSGDFDLCCMSINVLSTGDPESHLTSYFSTDGQNNGFGYSSEAFDTLLATLSVTSDTQERIELVKEAEQILLDDSVCIYYCYPTMNFVTKANVSGVTSTPADYYWVSAETEVE